MDYCCESNVEVSYDTKRNRH